MSHEPLHIFFERPYPSANAVVLLGPAPVLVDPGFGSDVPQLLAWLGANEVNAAELACVVNTHYHSDHVGGNHVLQQQYECKVAAHAHDAAIVNGRHIDACAARWLRQPVEAYVVNRSLNEGDTVDTGAAEWRVLHSPGHTHGHISLFEPRTGVLIVGDAVHAADVGWLNPTLEGADCLARSIDTIDRLRALAPALALSGHGPAIGEPDKAFHSARRRFERWVADPEASAWHAAKRILAYAAMIEGGIDRDNLMPYLTVSPWIHDFARVPFGTTPAAFAKTLLEDMLRSGGVVWREGRLVATALHTPQDPSWPRTPSLPSHWDDK